jgi:ribosome modulation factor
MGYYRSPTPRPGICQALKQGRQAFFEGVPIDACLFEMGELRQLWRLGWFQAQRETIQVAKRETA